MYHITRYIIGHLTNQSFRAIDYTDRDNQTRNNREKIHKKHKKLTSQTSPLVDNGPVGFTSHSHVTRHFREVPPSQSRDWCKIRSSKLATKSNCNRKLRYKSLINSYNKLLTYRKLNIMNLKRGLCAFYTSPSGKETDQTCSTALGAQVDENTQKPKPNGSSSHHIWDTTQA